MIIAGSFCAGELLGSVSAMAAPRAAMIPPVVGLALGALYAFVQGPADEAEGALPPNARS